MSEGESRLMIARREWDLAKDADDLQRAAWAQLHGKWLIQEVRTLTEALKVFVRACEWCGNLIIPDPKSVKVPARRFCLPDKPKWESRCAMAHRQRRHRQKIKCAKEVKP